MKNRSAEKITGQLETGFPFQRTSTLVAQSVALAMMGTGFVYAAEADADAKDKKKSEEQAEVITVKGIRGSIEKSILTKKKADSIVEAISSEDIGKLPDATVAESISRLPGLTAQRNKSSGRAQNISVRGLSPDFNATTLNGREQASTGDSRGVEFDQFPAELLSGVQVYKTPEAGLVNQGLAATINLSTVRPLDHKNRAIAANYRKQRTGIESGAGEGDGDRASLSYIDQFADRRLGIALGFTRVKDTGAEQQKFNSWGGWAADVDYQGAKVKTPGGFTADTEQTTFERDGAAGVIQFKPSADFETSLDVFYSKGDFKISKKGLEGAIGGMSAGGYDPAGALINATVSNGVATAGTITNYKGVVRNHDERVEDKLTAIGWGTKFKLGDWKGDVDLSQSKVERNATRYETTAGQVGNGNIAPYNTGIGSISWTGFNGSNFDQVKYTTSLDYSDRSKIKLTDPMGWSGGESSPQAGYVALPTTTDEINAIRGSLKRSLELGPINAVEFGANYSERTKTHTAAEGRLVVIGTSASNPYAAAEVPGAGVAIAGTTGLKIAAWSPQGSLGTIYALPPKVDRDILNKDWAVDENLTTAFAKANIESELFGNPIRGNAGLQVVGTEQAGTGYYVNPNTCTGNTPETCPSQRVTVDHSYTDVLPSLNLAMEVGEDSVLRFGLARVMSRASMADMRGSSTFSYDATNQGGPRFEGSGGNPKLEPFRANAIDLSYEKYFGAKAYIALAGFHKSLRSYVYRREQTIDFSQYGVQLPAGLNPIGVFTQPANGTGGYLRGLEFSLSLPFGMLAPVLDGFGLQYNHSRTKSSISIPAADVNVIDAGMTNLPLPGLSKEIVNTRLYYEKHGFQFSAAKRQRSAFLGEVADFQDNRQLTFIDAESVVDLQLGYEFGSGWLKGLTLLAQANNVTNAEFKRYSGKPENVVERVKYGKTYLFGVNYKM